ncbi:hypothetical protein EYB53_024530, partial [Candidatus Chloroploca sp. M-50]
MLNQVRTAVRRKHDAFRTDEASSQCGSKIPLANSVFNHFAPIEEAKQALKQELWRCHSPLRPANGLVEELASPPTLVCQQYLAKKLTRRREGAKGSLTYAKNVAPLRLCAFASKQSPSLQGLGARPLLRSSSVV